MAIRQAPYWMAMRQQFVRLAALRREHEQFAAGCICADCQRWSRIAAELWAPWVTQHYNVKPVTHKSIRSESLSR